MQTKLVPINSIKANPNNPRIIKDDKFNKLVKSIAEFPKMLQLRPIVVDADNIVLGGNMRLKACKEAGLKEVYIIEAKDLTDSEQQQFIIKDNVGFGEWDWDLLANEWDADKLKDWGFDFPLLDKNIAENELNDLSDKIKSQFKIEIICKNEDEQEKTYNKLIEQNYECRLLTL
jgi:ParB-like chromosome segregation protein Spo0J